MPILRNLGPAARGAVVGAGIGILLPIGIFLWTLLIESLPGPRHEVVWLALTRVLIAGYPTALAVDVLAPSLQESAGSLLLYGLLFIAVVLNWVIIGALGGLVIGAIRRRR